MKEQLTIVQRLFSFCQTVSTHVFTQLFSLHLAYQLSIFFLPRVIQVFMDNYLTPKTATMQVILTLSAIYFFGVIVKSIVWFFSNGICIRWLL